MKKKQIYFFQSKKNPGYTDVEGLNLCNDDSSFTDNQLNEFKRKIIEGEDIDFSKLTCVPLELVITKFHYFKFENFYNKFVEVDDSHTGVPTEKHGKRSSSYLNELGLILANCLATFNEIINLGYTATQIMTKFEEFLVTQPPVPHPGPPSVSRPGQPRDLQHTGGASSGFIINMVIYLSNMYFTLLTIKVILRIFTVLQNMIFKGPEPIIGIALLLRIFMGTNWFSTYAYITYGLGWICNILFFRTTVLMGRDYYNELSESER